MVTPSDDFYCYHFNTIGNTIAMTDQSQQIVNKYAYTPFGIITNAVETVPQPFKYVGQYGVMTEPNGLCYMRARYYDPEVGRFISEDPIGFGGGDVNLYVYCQNNPIIFIDPMGLCAVNDGISFTKGQQTAIFTTISGVGAITLGAATGNPALLAGGIPILAHGIMCLSIEYGFHGDTSDIPSGWIIMRDIGKGIVENWPTGNTNDRACTAK